LISALVSSGSVIVVYTRTTTDLFIAPSIHIAEQFTLFLPEILSAMGLVGGHSVMSIGGIIYFARLLTIVALPLIIAKLLKITGKDLSMIRILLASVSCLAIVMIVVVIGSNERYLFTATLLLSVMFVIILEHFIENNRKTPAAIICVFVFAISGLSLGSLGVQRADLLKEDRQTVVDFIKAEGLTVGYGSFWHGPVLAAIADFEFSVIPLANGDTPLAPPRHQGVTLSQFNHTEDRVFLVLPIFEDYAARQIEQEWQILITGTRHSFSGGWIVYIFDYNPFRN